jgi:hypothetical protein
MSGTPQPDVEAHRVAQHSGRLNDGNMEVFMDVGLGEVIGMSADELRELIASVKDLREEKKHLRDLHEQLKNKVQELDDGLRQNDSRLEKLQVVEENIEYVMSKFEAVDNEDVEEADEEEPGIALEDQLRITEQSAKAIDLLSNHQLSTVWQTCSKNTFGDDYFDFLKILHRSSILILITLTLYCRVLHSDYAAQRILLQKTTNPRNVSVGSSRLPGRAIFSGDASHSRLLFVDKTSANVPCDQWQQCHGCSVSWYRQWPQLFRMVFASASCVPVPELQICKRRLPHCPLGAACNHWALPL